MIEIPSSVEGKQFDLYKLEQKLKPIGYSIGGNWDYDHGAFDYKINDEVGYQFLRLPFSAIDGQLDANNCTVELDVHSYCLISIKLAWMTIVSAGTSLGL